MHLTDCDSTTQRTGSTPELPWEICLIIIECAIASLSEDRNAFLNSATLSQQAAPALRNWWPSIARLLHVSSRTRYIISKAFSPIVLQERMVTPTTPPQHDWEELYARKELVLAMWALADYHLLDCSVKREERLKPPSFPPCEEILTTGNWMAAKLVGCTISVQWMADFMVNGNLPADPQREVTAHSRHVSGTGRDGFCTISDACSAMQHAWAAFEAASTPRPCNIFQRAIDGTLQAPSRRTTIEVRISLSQMGRTSELIIDELSCSRTWRFVTRRPHHCDS